MRALLTLLLLASSGPALAEDCAAYQEKVFGASDGPGARALGLYYNLQPSLKYAFGEDPTDWPQLVYVAPSKFDKLGLPEDTVAASYLAHEGPNKGNPRGVIYLTVHAFERSCSDMQTLFIIAHEVAHHLPRKGGQSHLTWIKSKKQEIFEPWWKQNAARIAKEAYELDAKFKAWVDAKKKAAPGEQVLPLENARFQSYAWRKYLEFAPGNKEMLSDSQRAQEREADADGIEWTVDHYNPLNKNDDEVRQEVKKFFDRLGAAERANPVDQPYLDHDPADQRARAAVDKAALRN